MEKFMKKTGLITLEYVNTVIKKRPRDIHKGQCGRVLIVAGSVGMAGAAVLAARGALKTGAGLVTVATLKELFPILQTAVPQATCMDVSGGFSKQSVEKYGGIAVGPGMGVDKRNYLLIEEILNTYKGTVILDADALNSLSAFDEGLRSLKERTFPVVVTPHPGEGDRLLEALGEPSIGTMGRTAAAETLSRRTGSVVLLKGADTVVTSENGGTYINTTGNPGMATGGSGDVLTGVIAAIAASGADAIDAAKAGAFVHGLAGDLAAEKQGQWGMTSVDIEEALPAALKTIVGN